MQARIPTIESIYKSSFGNYTYTSPMGTSSSTSVTFTSPFATYPGVDQRKAEDRAARIGLSSLLRRERPGDERRTKGKERKSAKISVADPGNVVSTNIRNREGYNACGG